MLIAIDHMPTDKSTWFQGFKWAEHWIQHGTELEHTFEFAHEGDGAVSKEFFEGARDYEEYHRQFKDHIDRRFINEDCEG